MIKTIREQYPDVVFHMTEKGPNLRKTSPESSILWWHRTISGALNNGCSSFCGWNSALDENGTPSLGNFDCAGLVGIHSRTQEITPSIQYHAFRHYAPFVKRGAKILHAPLNIPTAEGVDCIMFRNPDRSIVIVAGNAGDSHKPASIQIKLHDEYLKLRLPRQSVTTLLLEDAK